MLLKLLTNNQQNVRICEDYWLKSLNDKFAYKISDLAKKYKLKPYEINSIVRSNSYAYLNIDGFRCYRCEKPLRFRSRQSYKKRYEVNTSFCEECTSNKEPLKPTIEQTISDIRFQARYHADQLYAEQIDQVSIIYRAAAIQALDSEGTGYMKAMQTYPSQLLSPDPYFDKKIIEHLLDNHLLILKADVAEEAVDLPNSEFISIDYLLTPLDFSDTPAIQHANNVSFKGLKNLISSTGLNRYEVSLPFLELCKDILYYECLAYFKNILIKYELPILPSQTEQVLRLCLESFSVAQVCNFIWHSVREAALHYMQEGISIMDATVIALEHILTNMNKAIMKGAEVESFERDLTLPQSVLSRLVFGTILGAENGGLTVPLNRIVGATQPLARNVAL